MTRRGGVNGRLWDQRLGAPRRWADERGVTLVELMVASGLGVSVLPRDAMTPKYHSTLVVPVPFARPIPARRVALAWRKSFPRLQAIAAIRDAVAACRPRK